MAGDGVRALVSAGQFSQLQALRIENGSIGEAEMKILVGINAPRLTFLDLPNNPLGNAGLAVLMNSSLPQHLKNLNLTKCRLTAPALIALSRGNLSQLIRLYLCTELVIQLKTIWEQCLIRRRCALLSRI